MTETTRRTRTWHGCGFLGASLDGFIARDDDDLSWLEAGHGERAHAVVHGGADALEWDDYFPTIDVLVMGRGTYDVVSGFDTWPFEGRTVLVLSTTADGADERIEVVPSLDAAVRRLDELGPDRVYVDGGRTLQSFLAAGLIDELTVSIAPVLIGSGRPLFGDVPADVPLTVRGVHSSGDGLVRITYDVGDAAVR